MVSQVARKLHVLPKERLRLSVPVGIPCLRAAAAAARWLPYLWGGPFLLSSLSQISSAAGPVVGVGDSNGSSDGRVGERTERPKNGGGRTNERASERANGKGKVRKASRASRERDPWNRGTSKETQRKEGIDASSQVGYPPSNDLDHLLHECTLLFLMAFVKMAFVFLLSNEVEADPVALVSVRVQRSCHGKFCLQQFQASLRSAYIYLFYSLLSSVTLRPWRTPIREPAF